MRVLVTGATGNVGRPTVDALRARAHDVVAAVRGGDPGPFEGVVDPTLGDVLGRPPTTMRAFLERERAIWA